MADKTVAEVYDGMTAHQQSALHWILGTITEPAIRDTLASLSPDEKTVILFMVKSATKEMLGMNGS